MASGRVAALRVLVETVRGDGTYGLGRRLGALPRLLRAATSGTYRGWDRRRALGLLVGALYVLSPVDLVPELLFNVLGLADDALVAAWLAGALLAEVDGYIRWEEQEQRVVQGDVVR